MSPRASGAERLMAALQQPLTRGLDLDDPRTTVLRREVLRRNRFLRRVYDAWFDRLLGALPAFDGPVLEIGTGASFLHERLPGLLRSDVLPLPDLEVVVDGVALPFADASLRAVVMTNTLHHVPDPIAFLAHAARCVAPGGRMAMIEPWVSRWSRWVYGRLHHEPFDPAAADWTLPAGGPLSTANGALPWILFDRDRDRVARAVPAWRLCRVEPMMPLRYLVSGGVGYRPLMPAATFPLWQLLDRLLTRWPRTWPCFALVVLERRGPGAPTADGGP